MIKDRNCNDLTEEEENKKWQGYTELYKKGLNNPDNHDGVVIYLELDLLEYEIKWAVGNITVNIARGSDVKNLPANVGDTGDLG